jgi:hypothetical protein
MAITTSNSIKVKARGREGRVVSCGDGRNMTDLAAGDHFLVHRAGGRVHM